MSKKWTKEPWHVLPEDSRIRRVEMTAEDYRRAVACVNTVEGLNLTKLERFFEDLSRTGCSCGGSEVLKCWTCKYYECVEEDEEHEV